MNDQPVNDPPIEERRRRIRRNTLVLALTAVAIYVGFIVSGVLKAQG